jgi:hypothetical protein
VARLAHPNIVAIHDAAGERPLVQTTNAVRAATR